ncbi:hypothetical protein V6N13_078190 [Hibiscus sabdariffa]|uniref:Peptidase C1A papain C-terminal domain-containing protein n=1 Tax=Hibiscus sabdariffa TaxID=183260 RepID=A0ABR2RMW4_9ROSI
MDYDVFVIVRNQGLAKELEYRYTAKDGNCSRRKETFRATQIVGYEDVPRENEEALLKAASQQPVSVALDCQGHTESNILIALVANIDPYQLPELLEHGWLND